MQTFNLFKRIGVAAFAYAAVIVGSMAVGTVPAHAANCTYMAHNQFGEYINGTHAKARALKRSTACRRAERRCNRRLRRAIRNGPNVTPRGSACREIGNL